MNLIEDMIKYTIRLKEFLQMNVSQNMELENKELILSKKFYKKLANERDKRKRELILNKMKSFEIILLKSKSKSDIPKAIWIEE